MPILLVLVTSAPCADKTLLFAVIVVEPKQMTTFLVRAYQAVTQFSLLICDPRSKLRRYDMLAL